MIHTQHMIKCIHLHVVLIKTTKTTEKRFGKTTTLLGSRPHKVSLVFFFNFGLNTIFTVQFYRAEIYVVLVFIVYSNPIFSVTFLCVFLVCRIILVRGFHLFNLHNYFVTLYRFLLLQYCITLIYYFLHW